MQKTKHDKPSPAASLLADLAHGKKVPADAINLLTTDHRQVEDWFAAYPTLEPAAKLRLVQDICTALKAHTTIEEELFYPEVRRATGADDLVEHGLQEHAGAKQMIAELEEMSDADAEMDRTVQKLSKAIADHIEEEEQELFPKARGSALDLMELGARLTALRLAAFADVTGKARSGLDRHP